MFEVWPEIMNGAGQKQLPVTYRAQLNGESCWAAVVQMIIEIVLRKATSYEDQLSIFQGHKSHGPKSLEIALKAFGVNSRYVPAALAFVDVVQAIDSGQPLIYDMTFQGVETTHVGVIAGYGMDRTGGEWVYILDPEDKAFRINGSSPFGWVRFSDLKQPRRPEITWTGSFYNLKKE
jgi:hypothetical protein